MSEILKERIVFPSADGIHEIVAHLYLPRTGMPKAVIQFAHGMAEHADRYDEIGRFFAENGYVFAINNHLGHGETATSSEELGFFAAEDGADTVVTDLYKFSLQLVARFPGLPLVLMGHSMGSFLARLYAMQHAKALTALVILGTSGPIAAVKLGKLVASVIASLLGPRHRSKFIRSLAFSGYLSRCGKNPSPNAWLSTLKNCEEAYEKDEKCGFTFTAQGYYDLFDMIDRVNRSDAVASYPRDLSVYIASGSEDPVGGYGKGPEILARRMRNAGMTDITFTLYAGARHELHNEFCKEQFLTDLLRYLDEKVSVQESLLGGNADDSVESNAAQALVNDPFAVNTAENSLPEANEPTNDRIESSDAK